MQPGIVATSTNKTTTFLKTKPRLYIIKDKTEDITKRNLKQLAAEGFYNYSSLFKK
jgi:hypothetical protein